MVFTVSISKLSIAEVFVLDDDRQRRALGKYGVEEADRSPRGKNRDNCIDDEDYK